MLLHPDRYPSSLAPDGSPRHFSFTFRSPRPPPPAATAPPALAPPDPAAGAGAADGATLYARRTQAAPPALRDDPPPSPKLTPVSIGQGLQVQPVGEAKASQRLQWRILGWDGGNQCDFLQRTLWLSLHGLSRNHF